MGRALFWNLEFLNDCVCEHREEETQGIDKEMIPTDTGQNTNMTP